MGLLTDDVRMIMAASRLCFAATVRADGSPNLSPKRWDRVYDGGHLAFMGIASPGTTDNLRRDPRIEVDAVDVFRRRGHRFAGTAQLVPPGEEVYEWLHEWLLDLNGPGYPAGQAVLVHVDRVLPILSPAYTFGHAEEAELTRAWRATYQRDA